MKFLFSLLLLRVLVLTETTTQAKPKPTKASPEHKQATSPPQTPTAADVLYGSHRRQVLDFYQVKSDKPTPLMFFIHGGGWHSGNKWGIIDFKPVLDAGISIVSIEYRFIQDADNAGVKPPVQWPLQDAARALQFVRSKAQEWNINPQRIGACGGSAGACSSLWLAFHDDMADPASSDPVAQQSTRLFCAAVIGAQTTLDPQQMREWTPNSTYGGHAFGISQKQSNKKAKTSFDLFHDSREKILPWIKQYSPYEHVSAGDPPIYLYYNNAANLNQPQKDPTHTANFGVKLQERCQALKVPCELYYHGGPKTTHKTAADFLIAKLKAK